MIKPKRNIAIETPSGQISTYTMESGKVVARLDWNAGCKPSLEKSMMSAQEFMDSECVRKMNPYTPRLTGVLIKSATLGSIVGSGEVQQIVPYARRQYYENKGDGVRGAKWFEVMKGAHLESIRKGAEKIIENR